MFSLAQELLHALGLWGTYGPFSLPSLWSAALGHWLPFTILQFPGDNEGLLVLIAAVSLLILQGVYTLK